MRKAIFLIIGIGGLLISCSREPVFPLEPHLEYVDIQPRTVTELVDSIFVTLRFTDGDGDLGDEVGTEMQSIRVRDMRILPDSTMLPDDLAAGTYS